MLFRYIEDVRPTLLIDGADSFAKDNEDIRSVFGDDDVIRSSDLVAKLTADPDRPWAAWKHGRPLTQKQLAGLLAPFHIISLTVHPPGLLDGKGYRRIDFQEAWAAYCPGQNTPSHQSLRFRSVQAS